MAVISYKCPNCGAKINFDPMLQKCNCDFCLSSFNINELELWSNESDNIKTKRDTENINEKISLYTCPSCGAQIIADKTTSATFCCYCHGPIILSENLSGDFKPSKIIPFMLSKEKAIESFIQWHKKKWFLPKVFRSQKNLEKISGLYIPFWLMDCDVTATLSARGEKITTWTSGDYRYTKTDIYNVFREADLSFDNIPSNASTKADDTVMESIEPFDYSDLKDFSLGYLPGFLAEKYDKTESQVMPVAKNRVNSATRNIIRDSVSGYSVVKEKDSKTVYNKTSMEYALLPIWMITYSFKNKNYIFAINGQTGKLFGSLPVSRARIFILFLIVFIIVFSGALIIGGTI